MLTLLLVSPTVASAFASPLTAMSNLTLVQNDDGVIVLEGATVIDGTGDLPKPNTNIIINGSRIASLSSNTANNYDFSLAKNVINLTGKYIIPGLFDMHAHVANVRKNSYNQDESEYMLRMLLAHGVTTIRNPGGPTEQSVALRENVSEGKIVGPQIFTAGQYVTKIEIKILTLESVL